jgi:hypothetical protein
VLALLLLIVVFFIVVFLILVILVLIIIVIVIIQQLDHLDLVGDSSRCAFAGFLVGLCCPWRRDETVHLARRRTLQDAPGVVIQFLLVLGGVALVVVMEVDKFLGEGASLMVARHAWAAPDRGRSGEGILPDKTRVAVRDTAFARLRPVELLDLRILTIPDLTEEGKRSAPSDDDVTVDRDGSGGGGGARTVASKRVRARMRA